MPVVGRARFPWLPLGTRLAPGAQSGRLLSGNADWQVVATDAGDRVALLLREDGPDGWQEELDALADALGTVPLRPVQGQPGTLACVLPADPPPVDLAGLGLRNPLLSGSEVAGLVDALAALVRRRPRAAWGSALFLPSVPYVLPTADGSDDRRALLLAAMSGGARNPSPERVHLLNPRLTADEVVQALRKLEMERPNPPRRPVAAPETFALPGQPALETLLRERVIDVLHRADQYAALGVLPPNGILLAGPPGCGKSYSASRLARFLGWPLHEIRPGEVGSSLLHETARRLSDAFDRAAREAPSIVLLEELDGLGGSRSHAHSAGVEEVNTLLRLVEPARDRGLLVLGTTNRLDAIDPALRRRGRFDHTVIMDYPDEAGMEAMLASLLEGRPRAPTLDLRGVARRLVRRPASDAAWVVDEAARLTVRAGKAAIDDFSFAQALRGLDGRVG